MSIHPDYDEAKRPGEFIHQKMLRNVFAALEVCLAECGAPFTADQRAVLDAAIASSGTDRLS